MVYAEMVLDGRSIRLFRFTPQDGEPGYFTDAGENTRKPLLRTPIDGARLEILWAGGERQAQRRVRPLANLGR